jgi:hypothetical protein
MFEETHQNNTTTPDIDFASRVKRIADDQFRRSVAGTSAASLHEITASSCVGPFQSQRSYVVFVSKSILNLLAELVVGIKGVCETEISDDDVLVAVEQQVFELQISMYDTLAVEVSNTGYELGEQLACRAVLQVTMVQDVVK